MKKATKIGALSVSICLSALIFAGCAASSQESSVAAVSPIESPNGLKALNSDLLGAAKEYAMPAGCVKSDKASLERGRLFFNELLNFRT
jgi:hypothetical protein